MRTARTILISGVLLLLGLWGPRVAVPAQQDPPRGDCCFHIFSAGSNLGWAYSLLNYTGVRTRLEPADETTFADILTAGRHIEMAARTCSSLNPAWPDWQNLKQYLANQVEEIRRRPDPLIRKQVTGNIRSTYLWSQPLRVRILDGQKYEHDTCAEKYFRLGFLLGYAQQTLAIAQELRQAGRPDWAGPVADGRGYLDACLQVLNEYFGLAGCTAIRDLDLPGRITSLLASDTGQLEVTNDALRAIWESLQQRLTRTCETATNPEPAPSGSGSGLVGVWRGTAPQSPTIRIELVNGEYRGILVELGFLQRSLGWTEGEQCWSFRRIGNSLVYRGKRKNHLPDQSIVWAPDDLALTGPDVLFFYAGGGGNATWRRVFTP
jgi:hypothetical protein